MPRLDEYGFVDPSVSLKTNTERLVQCHRCNETKPRHSLYWSLCKGCGKQFMIEVLILKIEGIQKDLSDLQNAGD